MHYRFVLFAGFLMLLGCAKRQKKDMLLVENSDLKVAQVSPVAALKKHSADTFKVNLESDAFVFGYADQQSVDVVVEIYGPDHKKLAGFDGPARGNEPFQFITTASGIHRIVVAPFEEELVRRAIENEMARDGQVYFIHNRVESIHSLASLVTKLVPKARVVVGHGQMGEKELEAVMLKFIRDEADVLVATTIVENGLDIPRANTILINRADRLGLAELYQLRGRVGRSHHRAYAYLLVPTEKILSDIARKRLSAMKEFSELGAGFRIAALDLELRGAGNLLGRQQHGHIESIGFDLYVQMLEGAVAKLKGEESMPELRTTLSLGMDVRIPQEYIPSENLRLRTYKRVSSIATEEEKQDVRKELEDRFGAMPKSVENLLEFAMLKSISEKLRIASVERQGTRVALRFHPETQLDPAAVVKVVRSRKGIKLDPSGVLWMELQRGESVPGALRNVLLGLRGEG